MRGRNWWLRARRTSIHPGRSASSESDGRGYSLDQIRLEIFDALRRAEEVALDVVALLALQKCELLLCLDAFADDPQIEAVRHGDDGRGDRGIAAIGRDVANELLVELESVDRESLEVT